MVPGGSFCIWGRPRASAPVQVVEVWREESWGLSCYLGHQMFCACMPAEDAERLVADFEWFFGDGGSLRILSFDS